MDKKKVNQILNGAYEISGGKPINTIKSIETAWVEVGPEKVPHETIKIEFYEKEGKIPHRCPVCGGSAILPHGFYRVPAGQEFSSTDYANEKCNSCIEGLIWV